MRLLHTKNQTFETFQGESVPPYAILSHTWGLDEVSHQDMLAWIQNRDEAVRQKKGFTKIELACRQAYHDDLDWVWIDTCNIDKSSSSELSEAINSMFQWYRNAAICYVYLEDFNSEEFDQFESTTEAKEVRTSYTLQKERKMRFLRSARWFSRGWTLQELIASERIFFFGAVPGGLQWSFLGSKKTEANYLSTITGIDRAVLDDPDRLPTVSLARRMSWAAPRETTRVEDIAYCLLGIFQVNMPLLYGEGTNAFIRLQEEILKNTEDESLFAWTEPVTVFGQNDGILATHPRAFKDSAEIVPYASKLEPYSMTNRGLRIEARLHPFVTPTSFERSDSCILHCRYEDQLESSIAIVLDSDSSTGKYRRSRNFRELILASHSVARTARIATIYIHKCGRYRARAIHQCVLRKFPDHRFNFELAIAFRIQYENFLGDVRLTPGGDRLNWSVQQRALIAPRSPYGYYSVLWFTRIFSEEWSERKYSDDQKVQNYGFAALLLLPEKNDYIPADIAETSSPGVLLMPITQKVRFDRVRRIFDLPQEVDFKKISVKSSETTLDLGDGTLVASLTKENRFGDDTYALDIAFRNQVAAGAQSQVQPVPEIKVLDPDGEDITWLRDNTKLTVSGSNATGFKNQVEDYKMPTYERPLGITFGPQSQSTNHPSQLI